MALFDKDVEHHRNQIQLGDRIFQKVYGRYSVYISVLTLQVTIILILFQIHDSI